MWITMNDSFLSVVQDRNNPDGAVVRARVRDDLHNVFDTTNFEAPIIETDDSDYRFRVFVPKAVVADLISTRINDIDYDNFKDSVDEDFRHAAYNNMWRVMYNVQTDLYGDQTYMWWDEHKK